MTAVATRLQLPGVHGVALAADRWDPAGTSAGLVLLLHGGGQTRHSWRHTGTNLAANGWTAVAVDARGHGDSDWDPDADYRQDALIGDLKSVIAHLGETPVLVGASMGGMTSMIGQGEDPSLARALVLVDIAPKVETAGTDKIVKFMSSGLDGFATLDDAAAAIAAYNPNRTTKASAEGLRKNLRLRGDRWFWHWDPRFLEPGDEATRSQPNSARSYNRARDAAAAIRVPTLLIRGAQSNVVSMDGVHELLTLIPGSRHIDVTDAGHMVAGDDNDVFTAGLVAFLDEL